MLTLKKSSSCTDLIFTSQPNIFLNPGVHSSIHADCHYQNAFVKFDLKMDYPVYHNIRSEALYHQEADAIPIR